MNKKRGSPVFTCLVFLLCPSLELPPCLRVPAGPWAATGHGHGSLGGRDLSASTPCTVGGLIAVIKVALNGVVIGSNYMQIRDCTSVSKH